ncbi:MAG: hypothetical protein R3324_08325, partial [Halobacteriales archaeon]|nr:hypothetical protein [Halobacteriales archaeon]
HGGSARFRTLWHVTPDGDVLVIRDDAPIPGNLGGFQVDANGDIVVATSGFGTNSSVIQRFAADGTLLRTITEREVEQLIGRGIERFGDLVIDGRGDLLVIADRERNDTGERPPRMLLRIAPDARDASIVLDAVDDRVNVPEGLARDPTGNVVVGGNDGLGLPPDDGIQRHCCGVLVVDPTDGSFAMRIPPAQYRRSDGRGGGVTLTFGGEPLFHSMSGYLGAGGIAVDPGGNYIAGYGVQALTLALFRVPIPAEFSTLTETDTFVQLGLEAFPLHVRTRDVKDPRNLAFGDIAIDRGGDVLVVGYNSEREGIWRITPAGTAFQLADIAEHDRLKTPWRLGVEPDVRRVTAKDIPPLPRLRVTDLRLGQADCRGDVRMGVTVENTGSAVAKPPVGVRFFDGDPLTDGVVIGSTTSDAPISPGESVDLDATWTAPSPGHHHVYAWMTGAATNTPFAAFRVCGSQDLPRPLSITPTDVTNTVGSNQTFAATLEILGEPVPGVPIDFGVTGANPTEKTVTSDRSGIASFTYTGSDSGEDTVVATLSRATTVRSTPARVGWQAHRNRPPTADAGGPYVRTEGATLTLNGTGSFDIDGDELT